MSGGAPVVRDRRQ